MIRGLCNKFEYNQNRHYFFEHLILHTQCFTTNLSLWGGGGGDSVHQNKEKVPVIIFSTILIF